MSYFKSVVLLAFSLLVMVLSYPNTNQKVQNQNNLHDGAKDCPIKILITGGRNANYEPEGSSMEIYYPDMPTKNHLVNVSLLIPRIYHISELLDDHTVITCGGNDPSSFEELNSCEIFDLLTNKVTMANNLTIYRSSPGSAVLDGVVYVCGGDAGFSDDVEHEQIASCERYQDGVWTRVASMNKKRDSFDMVVFEGHLVAVGGYDGTDTNLKSVERYNSDNNSWSMIEPMLEGAFFVGAAVFRKSLIMCADFLETEYYCQSYDSSKNKWSPFAKTNNTIETSNLIAAGGRLFVFGGLVSPTYVKVVQSYDPTEEKWFTTHPMIVDREGPSVVVIPSC